MKPIVQALILIASAAVIALAANAMASRDRKLVLPGYYPGARQVPRASVAASSTVAAPSPKPLVPSPSAPVPSPKSLIPENTTRIEQPSNPATQQASKATEQTKQARKQPTTNPPAQPVNPSTRKPVNPTPPPAPVAKTEFAPHPDKPYIEVGYDDAAALHAQGALTLDARRTNIYEQGHIAGARPFSVWESDVDEKVNKLYEERSDPREQLKPILVYCSGGDCEDSHMLAQKLWGVQFNNVYVYKDGFPDWEKHHGPIHTGPTP